MRGVSEIEVYARFCETDAAGHINNTSYFIYMEEARSKFFQGIGFTGEDTRGNIDFIIASTSCDFIAQAFTGQDLRVKTMVDRIGSKSFTLVHTITDGNSEALVAKGQATIVCFDYRAQQTEMIPHTLRVLLEKQRVPA